MANHQNIAINALDRCNLQMDMIFQRLEEIDSSYMHEKVDDNSWSVIQIFNHLLESEVLTLKYLKYKMGEGAEFGKESLKTKLKFKLAMIVYSFPVKFKAPKKLSNPANEPNLELMKTKFIEVRTDLRTFIDQQKPDFFTKASCKHPLIGRISLVKMIRFYHKHIAHHEKQILRRLISISKRID